MTRFPSTGHSIASEERSRDGQSLSRPDLQAPASCCFRRLNGPSIPPIAPYSITMILTKVGPQQNMRRSQACSTNHDVHIASDEVTNRRSTRTRQFMAPERCFETDKDGWHWQTWVAPAGDPPAPGVGRSARPSETAHSARWPNWVPGTMLTCHGGWHRPGWVAPVKVGGTGRRAACIRCRAIRPNRKKLHIRLAGQIGYQAPS